MVLIWNFFQDMSGHERCEQFDTKAINNSFLSSGLLGLSPCKFWQVLVYLSKYLIFLQISFFTSMKKLKNSLELPNPTRNTQKFGSTDQSVAQQFIHELFTLVDCTISRSCCEIFNDVMVLMWDFFQDMSGHERCKQFDTKAINHSFLSSKSRLNVIGFLYE